MEEAACKAKACIGERRSVAGIVFDGASFLLASRKNAGKMGGRWEFIGGKVEEGETLEKALVREFKEKIGVEVATASLIRSTEFETENGSAMLYAY